jgi:TRAP-type C4-dicarboxylate transport system permease small subunit
VTTEPGALARFERWVGGASRCGALLAGVCMTVLVVLILAQIVVRNLLGLSFEFALNLGGWLFVALSFLAFAWVLREQAHIRLTLLTERLRPRTQAALDLAMNLISLGFCLFFLVSLWRNLAQIYRTGVSAPGALDVPLYPVWVVAFLGMVLLVLQFVAEVLGGWQALRRGHD